MFLTLATAALFGVLHAFEVDHMLAVTTFVSRRPTLGTAARFGARWGVGHSVAVLLVGGGLLLSGLRWPARYDAFGEALVGVMLVVLGTWALVSARKLHLHTAEEHGGHAHLHLHHGARAPHDHDHVHAHVHPEPSRRGPDHAHGGITLVGLLHGLAGTGGVVALVPVTLLRDVTLGLGYLAAFGVGVTLAMTAFALAAAAAMRQATVRSLLWGRRVTQLVGVTGCIVGCWWVGRALGAP